RGLDGAGGHGLLDVTVTPTGDSTRTGAVLGAPGDMSPEQVRGEAVDAPTGLLSLGAGGYEMLSCPRALPCGPPGESGYAILHNEPPPLEPEVGAPLAQVVSRCLEKESERRFQTARDLAFALEVLSGGSGTQTLPGKIAPPLVRRRRLRLALAAVLA